MLRPAMARDFHAFPGFRFRRWGTLWADPASFPGFLKKVRIAAGKEETVDIIQKPVLCLNRSIIPPSVAAWLAVKTVGPQCCPDPLLPFVVHVLAFLSIVLGNMTAV